MFGMQSLQSRAGIHFLIASTMADPFLDRLNDVLLSANNSHRHFMELAAGMSFSLPEAEVEKGEEEKVEKGEQLALSPITDPSSDEAKGAPLQNMKAEPTHGVEAQSRADAGGGGHADAEGEGRARAEARGEGRGRCSSMEEECGEGGGPGGEELVEWLEVSPSR